MPGGKGKGSFGKGLQPGTGKGMGRGQGTGRMGGFGLGQGGNCVCASCGKKVAHQQGTPCFQMKCPACGAQMTRER